MDEALFWVDLETTGLDEANDIVLELAFIITDMELNIHDSYEAVFELERDPEFWDPFVVQMHTDNKLIRDCIVHGMPAKDIWSVVKEAIEAFVDDNGVKNLYLAGSTVGFDSRFIKRDAPEVHALFHYRSVDVSSLKILATSAGLELKVGTEKPHRAMQDIQDSHACARVNRDWLLISKTHIERIIDGL